jgi:hypothetical protein
MQSHGAPPERLTLPMVTLGLVLTGRQKVSSERLSENISQLSTGTMQKNGPKKKYWPHSRRQGFEEFGGSFGEVNDERTKMKKAFIFIWQEVSFGLIVFFVGSWYIVKDWIAGEPQYEHCPDRKEK